MLKFIRETWLLTFLVYAVGGPIFTGFVLVVGVILKSILRESHS